MGFPRVVPPRVVTYIDHQVFQVDSRNADDHRYMQTASRRYGAVFSKPGNGICHQVHMETFSTPGQMLLGSDSHTLCGRRTGMLAIGAGGLDVAVAMGGEPFFFRCRRCARVAARPTLAVGHREGRDPRDAPALTVRGRARPDHRVRRSRLRR